MSTKQQQSEDAHILRLAEYFGFDPPDPKLKPTTKYKHMPLPEAFLRLNTQLLKGKRWPMNYPIDITNPIP